MSPEEIIARAITKVVQRENLDLDLLKEEVPKRFWNKVLDELKDSKNSLGKPWTTMSLSAQWMRKKNNFIEIISKLHNVGADTPRSSKSDQTGIPESDQSGIRGQPDKDAPKTAAPAEWNPEWEEYLKQFIQNEIRGTEEYLLKTVQERIEKSFETKTSSSHLNADVPPAPPREKRRMKGTKGHLSARVDQNLLNLFEKDRDEKFEGNSSRCLNWVLWNFYGKPPLSFQSREGTDDFEK